MMASGIETFQRGEHLSAMRMNELVNAIENLIIRVNTLEIALEMSPEGAANLERARALLALEKK